MKAPKIKIPEVDLKTIAAENVKIDSFWNDLINAGDESYKKQKHMRRNVN